MNDYEASGAVPDPFPDVTFDPFSLEDFDVLVAATAVGRSESVDHEIPISDDVVMEAFGSDFAAQPERAAATIRTYCGRFGRKAVHLDLGDELVEDIRTRTVYVIDRVVDALLASGKMDRTEPLLERENYYGEGSWFDYGLEDGVMDDFPEECRMSAQKEMPPWPSEDGDGVSDCCKDNTPDFEDDIPF